MNRWLAWLDEVERWALWVVAATAGGMAALLLGAALWWAWLFWVTFYSTPESAPTTALVLFGIVAALAGIGVGLGQRLAPESPVVAMGVGSVRWLIVTGLAAGLTAAAAVRPVFGIPGTPSTRAAVFTLAVGLAIGFAQWLLLRRHGRLSLLWLPVTGFGFAGGTLMVGLGPNEGVTGLLKVGVAGIAVTSALQGALLFFGLGATAPASPVGGEPALEQREPPLEAPTGPRTPAS
ncbi:MAG: hypothetical protein HY329_14950 [Chloroflexi bacterium]|nr:hypothetical protein [Chloroflexota bacterium]